MPKVRPDLLERYYAMSLDGRVDHAALYEGASFDDYYALERLTFPTMLRETAASRAPLDRLRTPTPGPEPAPRPKARPMKIESLSRLPRLDLEKATIPPDVEHLILDRIVEIEGFRGLNRFASLACLTVSLSKSNDRVPASPPVALERVEVSDCGPACFESVLRSTASPHITFRHTEPVSLEILDGHGAIRDLSAGAPLFRRLDRLAGRALETLAISDVVMDERFRAILATLAPTLRRLSISSMRPFGPEMLPDLSTFPELGRVAISTIDYAEHREAWLSYVVARPQIDFIFGRIEPSSDRVEVVEIDRGVEILRIEKGKKVVFEVSGDLASEGSAEDNGALEERLREAAKAARKKVKWSSEADTFVAQTADLEAARWIIDQILEAKPPTAPKKASATKAAAKKSARS